MQSYYDFPTCIIRDIELTHPPYPLRFVSLLPTIRWKVPAIITNSKYRLPIIRTIIPFPRHGEYSQIVVIRRVHVESWESRLFDPILLTIDYFLSIVPVTNTFLRDTIRVILKKKISRWSPLFGTQLVRSRFYEHEKTLPTTISMYIYIYSVVLSSYSPTLWKQNKMIYLILASERILKKFLNLRVIIYCSNRENSLQCSHPFF